MKINPDRRVEEEIIATVLPVHARLVAADDADEPVERPADRAPASEIRLVPLHRVVAVLLGVLPLFMIVRVQHGRGKRLFARTGQHMHPPWLRVGPARRAARDASISSTARAAPDAAGTCAPIGATSIA